MKASIQALVGVDWAVDQHQVCVMGPGGAVVEERGVPNTPEGLAEFARHLQSLGDGDASSILVSIEVPHGPVVELLLERGFRVFAINPKQLDRFRDRFSVAGAKDDRLDARVLADSLRTDQPRFRELEPEEPVVVELREWSRMADDLRGESVRLENKLRQQLRRYYPQLIALGGSIGDNWILDLWDAAPTPTKARRIRPQTVARILKKHRIRRISADEVVATIRKPGFEVASGTVRAAQAHIGLLNQRLRVVQQQRRQAQRQLDNLIAQLAQPAEDDPPGNQREQHDVTILRSLPGVGRTVLAVLLAEASRPLQDRDYHALRAHSGVAPVTRRSGRSIVVSMRTACSPRLRNALYHWGRVAAQSDPIWKARYAALRARGHSHGRSVRTVGDRLLKVACVMLTQRTVYEPSRIARAA